MDVITAIIMVIIGIALLVQVLAGFKKILADPPHVAVPTFLGKRLPKVMKEGLNYFLGYPWLMNYIEINVQYKKLSFTQVVRSPKLGELRVPIEIGWIPAKDDGKLLITYLNVGREEVETFLRSTITQRLREWALSPIEGPRNAKELMSAQEEAIAVLLRTVVGVEEEEKKEERLEEIPSDIPTSILFKYFSKPRKMLNINEFQDWGEEKGWEKAEKNLLKKIREDHLDEDEAWKRAWSFLSEEERWGKIKRQLGEKEREIEEKVNRRKEIVKEIIGGRGNLKIPSLGIILLRFNIGEIEAIGELAKTMEYREKEEQERRGEIFEIETDLMKAEKIIKTAKEKGEELSLRDAYQIVMEWKATHEGRGFTIPGLSPTVTEILRKVLGERRG
jgi:regulator of protease activity HflC (stomatin/prohibitin superfamily)